MQPDMTPAARMLTRKQRLPVVVALREEGHSQRAIAGALGVSQDTVSRDLEQVNDTVQLPDRVTGLDGKSRTDVDCLRRKRGLAA